MSSVPPTPSPFDLQPPTAVAPAASFWSTWEDTLDIFYSPSAVFDRRRDARYALPLIILIVMSMAIYFLSIQMNDAVGDIEFAKAMAAQAKAGGKALDAKQIADAKAFAEKFKGVLAYLIPVFVAIGAWVSGLVIMMLGNLMGARLTFAQATTVSVLASFPELLGRAVMGAQALVLDAATITSKYTFAISAARFFPDATNSLILKLAAIADPFVIWSAVLLGFGAYIIGRMEKEKAAVLAIVHTIGFAFMFR